MLTNSNVTLLRYSPSADGFVVVGTHSAWTRRKTRIRLDDDGEYRCDRFVVRLPIAIDGGEADVLLGDLIYFGEVQSVTDEVVMRSSRISAVSINRFTTSPHVKLEAEYEYR